MRRPLLLLLWIVTDMLLFVLSYALAYVLRVGWILSSDFPLDRYLHIALFVSPVWVIILAQLGIFRLLRSQLSSRNVFHILFASIVGSSLFTLAYYFLYTAFFSRLLLVEAFAISTLVIVLWHGIFERVMRSVLRSGTPVYPTLIIGATREAASLIATLQKNKNPLTPVGILDSTGSKEKDLHGVPVLGKLDKLEETMTKKGITHLIQTSDLEHSINLISACRKRGIAYMLLPSVLGIVERDEQIEALEGRPVTIVRPKEAAWQWFFS